MNRICHFNQQLQNTPDLPHELCSPYHIVLIIKVRIYDITCIASKTYINIDIDRHIYKYVIQTEYLKLYNLL